MPCYPDYSTPWDNQTQLLLYYNTAGDITHCETAVLFLNDKIGRHNTFYKSIHVLYTRFKLWATKILKLDQNLTEFSGYRLKVSEFRRWWYLKVKILWIWTLIFIKIWNFMNFDVDDLQRLKFCKFRRWWSSKVKILINSSGYV